MQPRAVSPPGIIRQIRPVSCKTKKDLSARLLVRGIIRDKEINYLILDCFYTESWGCPEGYEMIAEDCIKIVRQKKKFLDAQLECEKDEGAKLARPQTLVDVSKHLACFGNVYAPSIFSRRTDASHWPVFDGK